MEGNARNDRRLVRLQSLETRIFRNCLPTLIYAFTAAHCSGPICHCEIVSASILPRHWLPTIDLVSCSFVEDKRAFTWDSHQRNYWKFICSTDVAVVCTLLHHFTIVIVISSRFQSDYLTENYSQLSILFLFFFFSPFFFQ